MGLVRRNVRKRIKRVILVGVITVFAGTSALGTQFYKGYKVKLRNEQTGSLGRSINSDVIKKASELRMAKFAAESKAKMDEFDAKSQDEMDKFVADSNARMAEFAAKSKSEMENFKQNGFDTDFDGFTGEDDFFSVPETTMPVTEAAVTETAAPAEEKTEYYVFGTIDESGCYAEAGELFAERERLYSIDPSASAYNWAVHVKDGKAVEAWTSAETLTEADLRPYTKEEQIEQYGSLKDGKPENVTGYWHTPFE